MKITLNLLIFLLFFKNHIIHHTVHENSENNTIIVIINATVLGERTRLLHIGGSTYIGSFVSSVL